MTVIATFHFPNYPMVFGDMLLSGPEDTSKICSLPTIGDVRNVFPEGSGWTITGTTQKIAIISDGCVVVWAGSKLGARFAIKELYQLASKQEITLSLIEATLRDINSDIAHLGTSLLGVVRSESGFETFAYQPDEKIIMADSTPVCLAGSGARPVAQFLTRVRLRPDYPHSAERAYSLGLQLGGIHLRMENANDNQLLQYFGGGYEVAVYNGERFTKDSGVTYILWDGRDPDHLSRFAHPSLVLTMNYVEGVLLIYSQKFEVKAGGKFEIGEISVNLVNPIYRNVDLSFTPTPASISQKTPWIVHCCLAKNGDGVKVITMIERQKHDGSDNINMDVQEGIILSVNYKKQFWHNLVAAIAAV